MSKSGIKVKLLGNDGNAFSILGAVSKALKKNGQAELAKEYMAEATKGDYDHLLATTSDYVEII